jgi:membrane dipeptidase
MDGIRFGAPMENHPRRRLLKFLACGLALPAFSSLAQTCTPIADAHSHIGLLEKKLNTIHLREIMERSGTSLIAWKVVADKSYIRVGPRAIEQFRAPVPGESMRLFKQTISDMRDYLKAQGIPHVTTPEDVDAALSGKPYIVLASEGANYLEDDADALNYAYAAGLRHLQLVHYSHNAIGDTQTMRPEHDGLDKFGRDLIKQCNQKGILIDIAHGTSDLIDQALEISATPLISSHGWTSDSDGSWIDQYGFQSRRMSVRTARKIAAKGGVIGLWAFGLNTQFYKLTRGNIDTYVKEILSMVEALGEDHVCFGTDMEGLQGNTVFDSYDDLRRVVDKLQARGMADAALRKVASGNYARVLRTALSHKA